VKSEFAAFYGPPENSTAYAPEIVHYAFHTSNSSICL